MSDFEIVTHRPKEIERCEPKPGDNLFYNGDKYKVCTGTRRRMNYQSCWFGRDGYCSFIGSVFICKMFKCYGVERQDKKDIYFKKI